MQRIIKFRGKVDGVWWYVSPDHILSLFQSFWNLVDLSTVGEYTSLNDALDVEIYEGDIVKKGTRIHEVLFHKGAFVIMLTHTHDGTPYYLDLRHDKADMVIIGNHHDNPELLESGEAS